jgi:cobalt/nickel transport system permease protein
MASTFRETPIRTSLLSRWDARWKLAGLFLLGLAFALISQPIPAAMALGISLGLMLIGRVPLEVMFGRLGIVLLAVLPLIVLLPLTHENGTTLAITLGLRAFALAGLAVTLLHTTPLNTAFTAAQRLGMPGVLVQVAQLALRYAYLFQHELWRLRVALFTRSFRPRANSHTYGTIGQTVGTLFVRGIDRSENVSEAMRCRGFDGRYRTLTEFHTRVVDVIGFAVMFAVGALLVIWDRQP